MELKHLLNSKRVSTVGEGAKIVSFHFDLKYWFIESPWYSMRSLQYYSFSEDTIALL